MVTRRSIFFPVGLAVSLSVRFPHHRISLTAAITTRCRIAISFCSGQVQLGLIRVGGGREQVEGRRRRCNNIRCRKLKAQPPINTVAHVRLNSGPFNSARLQPIRRVNSIRHNSCRYNIDHGYFHTSVNTTHGPPPRLPTPPPPATGFTCQLGNNLCWPRGTTDVTLSACFSILILVCISIYFFCVGFVPVFESSFTGRQRLHARRFRRVFAGGPPAVRR